MFEFFHQEMQGKEDLFKLLEANDQHTTVAVFDTYPIYKKEVIRLVNIINTNSYLKALKLLDCRLQADDVQILAEAILKNESLIEVKIELFADDSDSLKELMKHVETHLKQNMIKNRFEIRLLN